MTWDNFTEETRPLIKGGIINECALLASQYAEIPGAGAYADMLCEYTLRGKLLRGVFVRLSTLSFGGASEPHIIKAAAALELAQSAFLIHDDIMDGDTLRRGKPSLHTLIGQNGAICLGDLALLRAFHLLSFNAKLAELFSGHLGATALGQALELSTASKGTEPPMEDIFSILIHKSARYTFVLPFEAGAVLAGQSPDPALSELGRSMGLIFQIKDDQLNLLSPGHTGKSAGGDIRENKKTVCRAVLLKNYPPAAPLFGREDTLEQVQKLYMSHASSEVEGIIKNFRDKAEALLEALPIQKETRPLWSGLMHYLNERTY